MIVQRGVYVVTCALAIIVGACGENSPNPLAPTNTTSPSNPSSSALKHSEGDSPATPPLDLSGLSEAARAFVLAANIDNPHWLFGAVTIWPRGVPIKTYLQDLSVSDQLRIKQFYEEVTGGGVILELVNTPEEAERGIRIFHALLPPQIPDGICGFTSPTAENHVITSATGYVALGLKPDCYGGDGWMLAVYAHEVGHALGSMGHQFEPYDQTMSAPPSLEVRATPPFREGMTYLYRQISGARP